MSKGIIIFLVTNKLCQRQNHKMPSRLLKMLSHDAIKFGRNFQGENWFRTILGLFRNWFLRNAALESRWNDKFYEKFKWNFDECASKSIEVPTDIIPSVACFNTGLYLSRFESEFVLPRTSLVEYCSHKMTPIYIVSTLCLLKSATVTEEWTEIWVAANKRA